MASKNRQQHQHDNSTCQNAESNRKSSEAHADRVVSIHVERLGRPEHEDGEEIGARDEGDDKCESEDARLLAQTLGEHGVLCTVYFPKDEGYEQNCTEDKRHEHVGGAPFVLVSVVMLAEAGRGVEYDLPSPLHSHHEEKHSADRQETSDVVDLSEHLFP